MSSFLWYGVRQIRGNILYFSCIFDFNICVCRTWLYAVGCACFSLCISVYDCMLLGTPVSQSVYLCTWLYAVGCTCFTVCVSLYMIVCSWVHLFHSLCISVHDCMLLGAPVSWSVYLCTWLYAVVCTCFSLCIPVHDYMLLGSPDVILCGWPTNKSVLFQFTYLCTPCLNCFMCWNCLFAERSSAIKLSYIYVSRLFIMNAILFMCVDNQQLPFLFGA